MSGISETPPMTYHYVGPDPAMLEREGRKFWITIECQNWKLEGPAIREGQRLVIENVGAWQFHECHGIHEQTPGPIETVRRAEEATNVLAWLTAIGAQKGE